jgi:AbrB family looped-hinge helix DNA binding protein
MKATVSQKGQVTIPKTLRDRLGIKAGQVLEFEERGGELVARKTMAKSPVSSLYGVLDLGASTDQFLDELRGPGPG